MRAIFTLIVSTFFQKWSHQLGLCWKRFLRNFCHWYSCWLPVNRPTHNKNLKSHQSIMCEETKRREMTPTRGKKKGISNQKRNWWNQTESKSDRASISAIMSFSAQWRKPQFTKTRFQFRLNFSRIFHLFKRSYFLRQRLPRIYICFSSCSFSEKESEFYCVESWRFAKLLRALYSNSKAWSYNQNGGFLGRKKWFPAEIVSYIKCW